jgi:hypothetical protein
MRTSLRFTVIRNLSVFFLTLIWLVFTSPAQAQIPGMPGLATAAAEGLGVSDSKLGSVLFYHYYVSDVSSSTVNTRLTITNANPSVDIAIHLFFVDSTTCNIADSYICLTKNQTASFMASDIDPNVTGYLIAVAVDGEGRPASFNFLAGDELIVTPTGHRFGLPATAAARRDGNFVSPADLDGVTTTMYFNGQQYDYLPSTMVLDNFPSQQAGAGSSGGDTRLYVYTPLTNLASSSGASGSLFFLVHDDQERNFSGSLSYTCYLSSDKQRITSLRTAPNINTIVPPGQSGWASFYATGNYSVRANIAGQSLTLKNLPLLGASATRLGNFTGGHNLRQATLFDKYSITLPLLPPLCGATLNYPARDSSLLGDEF